MLWVLLNWILSAIIFFATGSFFNKYVLKNENITVLNYFIGLFSCNLILSFISIFRGIDFYIFYLFLAGSIFYIFLNRKSFIPSIPTLSNLSILIPISILCLVVSSGAMLITDDGSFFIQAVKWIEEYGTIKGTGNLEARIAYNSNVFVLHAFTTMRFLLAEGFNDLNGLSLLLFSVYALKGFTNYKSNITFSGFLKLFSLIYLFKKYISSFDPDLLNILFGFIILILFVEKTEDDQVKNWDYKSDIICLFSFYIISIKFSSILLFLIPLFLLYKSDKIKKPSISFYIGIVLLLIWLYRNYIISGYILFPLTFIDFFDVDWKVPHIEAEKYYAHISEYAKRNVDISNDLIKSNITGFSWFHDWFSSDWLTSITFVSIVSSSVIWIYFIVAKQKKYLPLAVILFIQLAWWFLQYPSLRIAWPSISCLIAGAVFFIYASVKDKKLSVRIPVLIILLIYLMTYKNVVDSFNSQKINLIKPSKSLEKKKNFDNYCWDADLPCSSENKIIYRGENITDGFKSTN